MVHGPNPAHWIVLEVHQRRKVFTLLNGWEKKESKEEQYSVTHKNHMKFEFQYS